MSCQLEEIISQEIVVRGLDEVIQEEDIDTALETIDVSGEMRRSERGTQKREVLEGQRLPPRQKQRLERKGGVYSARCHKGVE